MRGKDLACRRITILLGAYVLGGLRDHQEAQVKTHLSWCSRCSAEYEELAVVPALLDMISGEEAGGAVDEDEAGGAVDESAQLPVAQAVCDGDGDGTVLPYPLPLRPPPSRTTPRS
jgi:anti-sigma factor RsiW